MIDPRVNPVDDLIASRIGCPPLELDTAVLTRYQLEALKRTVKYAYARSDFYKTLYNGFSPDDIRTLQDINKLPYTREEDLAGNEWRFQCISSSDVSRIVTVPVSDTYNDPEMIIMSTSGTHGKSKRLAFTENDIKKAVNFIYRGYLTMHCEMNEKMTVMMSGTSPGSIGDLVRRAIRPLDMDVSVYGAVTDIKDAYEYIMEVKPSVIEGIPWQTAALASYGSKYGNPEKEFIRSVNLSADLAPDSLVSRIRALWECSVHRHYGMTEMCIFGGVECGKGKGYHMRSCDLLFEIPETDENGYGEVVITTLDREAMPLIRYRTGDIGRIDFSRCGCGSRIPRIEKLLGRKSDILNIYGNNIFYSDISDALYSIDRLTDFDLAAKYRSEAQNNCPIESLYLTVRTFPGIMINEDIVRQALGRVKTPGGFPSDKDFLKISFEETLSFAGAYNMKKRVLRL